MQKILVATDLSARSDRALHRALALAKERNAEVEVVSVIDDDAPEVVVGQVEAQAKRALDEQLQATPLSQEVRLNKTLIRGQDFAEIIKRGRDVKADLVVLGISRHTSASLFRGTTAERVVRLGRSPALVVKSASTAPYSRIVIGVDLSVHSRRAVEFAATFAPNAEIYCIHATHEAFVGFLSEESRAELAEEEQSEFSQALERDLDGIAQRLGTSRSRFHSVMKVAEPFDALIECITELQADLAVVGTHARSGIAQAVLGSVAEDMLAEAPVDVLVVRAW